MTLERFSDYQSIQDYITIPRCIDAIVEFIGEYPNCTQRNMRDVKLWTKGANYHGKLADLCELLQKHSVILNTGTFGKSSYEINPDFAPSIDEWNALRDLLTLEYKYQCADRKSASGPVTPPEPESPSESLSAPATATPEPAVTEPETQEEFTEKKIEVSIKDQLRQVAKQFYEDCPNGKQLNALYQESTLYLESYLTANGYDPKDAELAQLINNLGNAIREAYFKANRGPQNRGY